MSIHSDDLILPFALTPFDAILIFDALDAYGGKFRGDDGELDMTLGVIRQCSRLMDDITEKFAPYTRDELTSCPPETRFRQDE